MTNVWIRRALFGLLGLVVLLALVVAWLVSTFDANRYKGLAVDWMKREHDRTLVIEGPVELSVVPRLAIRLSDVRLSERGRPAEFAAVDEAALSLELLPLLSKQLVVQRIGAKGVRVVYSRNAQGQSNLDDFLSASKTADSGGPAPDAGASALAFDVGAVELDDVRASVRDDKTPLRGEITLVSLRSGRLANDVESPVSLRAELALSAPALRGRLSGDTQLRFQQASGTVTLRDMKLDYKGEAAGIKGIQATLGGLLTYSGETQSMSAEALKLDLDATLGELRLVDSSVAAERFTFDPARKALALAKLQVHVAGRQGKDPLAFDLDWPQLDVTGESVKGSDFSGRFSLAGATALEGTFKSGPPSGSFERLRLPAVNASLKGRSGPREIDGTFKSDLLLQIARTALALERLEIQAQVKEPSVQPLDLAVGGNAEVSAKDARWNLSGRLAPQGAQRSDTGNKFTSEGSAKLEGEAPTLQVRARFDSLDLNQLLPPETPGAATTPRPASSPASGPASPGADVPVDLGGLRAVNGKFDLQAGSLVWQQIRIDDARLDAALDKGLLKLNRIHGKAWGGTIDASGQADARSNAVALKLAGNSVDVNALLRDTAGFDRLEGTGRVNADLESLGRNVQEMKSRLKGTAALQLRDGAVKGVNLAKTFRQAKAALTLRQDAVQRAGNTEKTDFSELNATFRIAEGVARNDDLEMKSPFLRLGGAGAIDIGRSRIDYTARATVTATSKGQEGADLALLKGLTIPVKLSGPLDAVDWQVQWSAVAAGALGNKVQDKLRESLGDKLGLDPSGGKADPKSPADKPARPEDKVKDKLRGLFK